ncbi:hypothetical protein [Lysinibacter sp. HNR]|uniref:hypothetical protein n=1 Tax=Lysinibacter sp. HNR TaxID=3031408 RepID=UPI002435C2C8|nr:hypothetical protein [Lysinibacter sp. HNR]WGD37402.1 hypothetical protein FrondiHNR_00320 [Lysinibacter sp. HNR]
MNPSSPGDLQFSAHDGQLSARDIRQQPLDTDLQIQHRVQYLIGAAQRRRVWFMYLDRANVQIPVVMPMADFPLEVGEEDGDHVSRALARFMREVGALQVFLVWERPGGRTLRRSERGWAREILHGCALGGVPIRAQLLSHSGGVRWLSPDDFI